MNKKTKGLEVSSQAKEKEDVQLSNERRRKQQQAKDLNSRRVGIQKRIQIDKERKSKLNASYRSLNNQVYYKDNAIRAAARNLRNIEARITQYSYDVADKQRKVRDIEKKRKCGFGKKRKREIATDGKAGQNDEDAIPIQNNTDSLDRYVEEHGNDIDFEKNNINNEVGEIINDENVSNTMSGSINKKTRIEDEGNKRVGKEKELQNMPQKRNGVNEGLSSSIIEDEYEETNNTNGEIIDDLDQKSLDEILNEKDMEGGIWIEDDIADEKEEFPKREKRKAFWGGLRRFFRIITAPIRWVVSCVHSNTIGRIRGDLKKAKRGRDYIIRQKHNALQDKSRLNNDRNRLVNDRAWYANQMASKTNQIESLTRGLQKNSRQKYTIDSTLQSTNARLSAIKVALARIHVELKDLRFRKTKTLATVNELKTEATEKIKDLQELEDLSDMGIWAQEDILEDLQFVNSQIEKSVKNLRYLIC